jgi:hypothetical protein
LLAGKPLSHILAIGLHDYLDLVQIHLQKIAAAIGRAFFRDWRPGLEMRQEEAAVQETA